MAAKNGRGMKEKGAVYEREIAAHLNAQVYDGKEQAFRAPLSGGGVVNLEAGGADLLGTPGLFIEAKRVEKLSFREAMAQAEGNVGKRNTEDKPIVITRRNREATGQSVVIMRLDDFLPFYRAWLEREGYV